MSSTKRSAMNLLLAGSILWLILSILSLLSILIDYGIYYFSYFSTWVSFIGSILQFVVSLLVMIGIIKYRGTLAVPMIQTGQSSLTQTAATPVQAVPSRFCPNCGRQINVDAKYCSYCGWHAET